MKTEKIRIYYNGQFIEVTHEVYTVLIKSDRKIKYFENDLKEEKIILDKKGTVVEIIPSREDSLDRLQDDNERQFADNSDSVEEIALRNLRYEQLHNAISMLKPDEQALIEALYFNFLTQDDYAKQIGLSQQAVSKKRTKILKKLKIFIEK
ncbi:MAG: sigma-70 family RNA polymerase sigma factor [Clostridia bacterium]|nr:sigma-70 family RNA polymerase sigma factor [Clostridia bacterium]